MPALRSITRLYPASFLVVCLLLISDVILGQNSYAPGRLLIKLKKSTIEAASFKIRIDQDGNVMTGVTSLNILNRQVKVKEFKKAYKERKYSLLEEQIGVDRWYMLQVPTESDIETIVAQYRQDPNIEYATPDWYAYHTDVPNDPLYSSQWGHNNTGQLLDYCWGCGGHPNGTPVGTPGFDSDAEAAWEQSQEYGDSLVIIGILDSGVDIYHPDLRLVPGYDFGDDDDNPHDDSDDPGHGTACAGIAAARANNGIGVAGVAGGCSVMPLKVANSAGSMAFSSIQNALYYAADNGVDIASMSFSANLENDPATDDAILYAYSAGVTLLAATSNNNENFIRYPANNQYVIGVGAASPCGDRKRSSNITSDLNPNVIPDPNGYTCDGERWWGSNYGSETPDAPGAVDIIAPTILPTTDISGTGGYDAGDYYMWFNGTSCATPYAAGVAALIKSKYPGWTAEQIRNQLVNTASDIQNVESDPGFDRYSGHGMVNAYAALIQTATPGFMPPPGSYISPQDVTITCTTPGATIYYTTDGSDPDDSDIEYTVTPVHLEAATTLKAIAYHPDFSPSFIQAGIYEFVPPIDIFPYIVDFENGGSLPDNWENAVDDDFDWIPDMGGTPSSSTGPSTDHTLGSTLGYYLYTESSSPNYPNKTAGILTPFIDITSLSDPFLNFWYHMYGTAMGELHVDIFFEDAWNNDVMPVLSGNSGDAWYEQIVDLEAFPGIIRLRFRGITGSSFTSDMAIDDVIIQSSDTESILVVSPNGGEEIFVGTVYDITWSSNNTSGFVNLEYSTSNGASWSDITGGINTEDDGFFAWTIPDEPSSNCLVRVTDADGNPTDVSNDVFTIAGPDYSEIITKRISQISTNSAQSGGEVISEGGAAVSVRGICWSTDHSPAITDNYTSDGSGLGEYTSNLSGLTPNTVYYVRAYATNSVGTSYGDEISFTTFDLVPPDNFSGELDSLNGIVELYWDYYYIDEDFADNSANNWVSVTGDWLTDSEIFMVNSGTYDYSTAYFNAEFSDFEFEVDVRKTIGSWNLVGIYFNGDPDILTSNGGWSNGYRLALGTASDWSSWSLGKYINGNYSVIQSWVVSTDINPDGFGYWNKLKVICSDGTIDVYFNDSLQGTYNDVSFSSGRIGLAMFDNTGGHGEFDNIKLKAIQYADAIPGFQNFNVYRNDNLTGTPDTLSFTDNLPGYGVYQYEVKAMYDIGESVSSGYLTFEWIDQSSSDQVITLSEGWNIFSLAVTPEDTDLKSIVQPLIDEGSLIKVQDETGNAIEDVFPIGWINDIGYWNYAEGYKIKLNTTTALVKTGIPVSLPADINLSAGWNIMGYPALAAQDAEAAVADLISSGYLIKVQDEAGNAIEDVFPIGWINDIVNFNPGEGYKIKVNTDCILTISEPAGMFKSTVGSTNNTNKIGKTSHFKSSWTGNGLDHMNIYITYATFDGISLSDGDEIAVFDGQQCVGASPVNGNERFTAIAASKDDPETTEMDGYLEGNSIQIRIWNNKYASEIVVDNPEYAAGYHGYFELMGTTVAAIKLTSGDLPDGISLRTTLGDNYPNPFNTETTIPFRLENKAEVDLAIYNLMGQRITTLLAMTMSSGSYKVKWDRTDNENNTVPQGIYICRLRAGNHIFNKMIEIY